MGSCRVWGSSQPGLRPLRSGPCHRWGGVRSHLGEAPPVAWLFPSLKVSGLDFLDFGLARSGSGARPAEAPCVAAPRSINSDSPPLRPRGTVALAFTFAFHKSHTRHASSFLQGQEVESVILKLWGLRAGGGGHWDHTPALNERAKCGLPRWPLAVGSGVRRGCLPASLCCLSGCPGKGVGETLTPQGPHICYVAHLHAWQGRGGRGR